MMVTMIEVPDNLVDFLGRTGWRVGRCVDVSGLTGALREAGFVVPGSATEFLARFGLLRFDHEPSLELNGVRMWTRTVFNPTAVATRRDRRVADACAAIAGAPLCPVGTDGFHNTIYITDDGRFFAGRDSFVFHYADSASELFQAMRDGVRPARIGQWRELAPDVE